MLLDTLACTCPQVELGAELVHGTNTLLTRFAAEHGHELQPCFVWAHGDGGPVQEPINGGYGLYYIGSTPAETAKPAAAAAAGSSSALAMEAEAHQELALRSVQESESTSRLKPLHSGDQLWTQGPGEQPQASPVTNCVPSCSTAAAGGEVHAAPRLLRYDAKDADFVGLNEALWALEGLGEESVDERLSLADHLIKLGMNPTMQVSGDPQAVAFLGTIAQYLSRFN